MLLCPADMWVNLHIVTSYYTCISKGCNHVSNFSRSVANLKFADAGLFGLWRVKIWRDCHLYVFCLILSYTSCLADPKCSIEAFFDINTILFWSVLVNECCAWEKNFPYLWIYFCDQSNYDSVDRGGRLEETTAFLIATLIEPLSDHNIGCSVFSHVLVFVRCTRLSYRSLLWWF